MYQSIRPPVTLQAARAKAGIAPGVPSPCISVCRMSPDRSHCEGCFRTLDEIRLWSRADGSLRRGIWAQLLGRAGIGLETLP